jgi:integrase
VESAVLKLKQRIIKTQRGETRRWYIKGTCQYTGGPVRESTGTDSKEEAERQLASYLARARDESILGTCNGTALFAEAVTEYIGKHGEGRFVDPLLTRFGTTKLRDIKDNDLTKFGELQYPGAKASTLVRQLYGPMQAIWNCAVRAQMVGPRHFAKPKVPKLKAVSVTEAWLLKLLKVGMTTLQQRTTVLFMSFSGCRASEVVNILVRHYDPEAGRVLVANTKNDEPREILLPPFVNEAMKLLELSDDPEAKLFNYASRFSLTRIIKRGCKRAGLKYFSPHKVGRHTFAARFLADGNSLLALQEAGGWKGLGVIERCYKHLERSQVQRAVASVTTSLDRIDFSEQGENATVLKLSHE